MYRVLKPGGVAIFTFSNRMFYEKVGAARWPGHGAALWIVAGCDRRRA